MTYKLTVTTLALTAITSTVAATHAKPDTEHPHIVLILCDDMGFSDLSCYGGEIHTPNIDYLAEAAPVVPPYSPDIISTKRKWDG